MATWEGLSTDARSFREHLADDPEVSGRVSPAALDAAMDAAIHLRSVDHVFARVFGAASL